MKHSREQFVLDLSGRGWGGLLRCGPEFVAALHVAPSLVANARVIHHLWPSRNNLKCVRSLSLSIILARDLGKRVARSGAGRVRRCMWHKPTRAQQDIMLAVPPETEVARSQLIKLL